MAPQQDYAATVTVGTDELSETVIETDVEQAIMEDAVIDEPIAVIPKKRGRPPKRPKAPVVSETPDDAPEEPRKTTITYYLAIFSESQMHKPSKQRKPINTFLRLA
ncbi:hypothetical protein BU15DRAFT_76804 [Melanogaster broomeanus]|nr:hypothetical protein BU15DRAFT_76804 [Melanogaster broomeanus]